MPKKNDIAIRWSDKPSAVNRIHKLGGVPVHGLPHHFRCPGGVAAVVCDGNIVRLAFRATSIVGPSQVTLANGKACERGYLIRADRRTLHQPKPAMKVPIKGWYAIGAFRYFDAKKMKAVLIGDSTGDSPSAHTDLSDKDCGITFCPYTGGIPGQPKSSPEAVMVDQYVRWMKDRAVFGHNYLREPKLFVDLFDRTHWQLIEAKADVSRKVLRMAIGQLRDYKRYYCVRHPSLAVLLSRRPTDSCMRLLVDNKITVIWRTPCGRFSSRRWQSANK